MGSKEYGSMHGQIIDNTKQRTIGLSVGTSLSDYLSYIILPGRAAPILASGIGVSLKSWRISDHVIWFMSLKVFATDLAQL